MSEYRTLQQNQSLNLEYEKNKKEREMQEEIERLNNIITELEKWLKQEIDNFESITYLFDHLYDRDIQTYKRVLNKLKNLKGGEIKSEY